MDSLVKMLEENNIGKWLTNVSLRKYTTYHVGGIAKYIVFPKNSDKLIILLKYLKNQKIKYKILGNGSNTLFSDKPYDGVIIKLDNFNNLTIYGTKMTVGSGYSLIKLAKEAEKRGLAGLEFASGIPGSIGGAIYMNAGAYKSDMGYIVTNVKVLTPNFKIIQMTNTELHFHYRSSFFQKNPGYICLEATLKLQKGKKEFIEKVNRERKQRRVATQPLEYPSAGSVFRNPEGMYAGELIEKLGLKGLYKGGAQVSEKHANFIINRQQATSQDIKDLMDFVQEAVYEKYKIKLKIEQELVNWE